jgi:hypothetical protein
MKLPTPVLTSADTAVFLRARLGPLRSWPDFLTDNIRGKQDIEGYRLLPCCRVRGRGFRPYYAVADIQEFVSRVMAADRNAGRVPIRAKTLMVDSSLAWRANNFDRHGSPIAGYAAAYGGASHV